MMEVQFGYILKSLFLPPGGLLLLAFLGLVLRRRRPAAGTALVLLALLTLWVLSLPLTAGHLAASLEHTAPIEADAPLSRGPGAIVVLGAGRYPAAPEYGGRDMASDRLLQRLQYAAELHRRTGLPLLVSGGRLGGWERAEAALMRDVLGRSFATPVRWLETDSLNTEQNARFSADILRRAGIGQVYVVTHAMHMPRALDAFARAGLSAVPAPTVYHRRGRAPRLMDWLPDARALALSRDALHEYVGRLWYSLRHGSVP